MMEQKKIIQIVINIILLWIFFYVFMNFAPTWLILLFGFSAFIIISLLTKIFDEDVVLFSALGFAATVLIVGGSL